MEWLVNIVVACVAIVWLVSLLRDVDDRQRRDERQRGAAEKLKADGWVDMTFEKNSTLLVARRPNQSWRLLREDGEVVFTCESEKMPEFHNGFWYCPSRRGDDGYVFYDAEGVSVRADDIRDRTNELLYYEDDRKEQRCLDCAHCVNTTTWFDAVTLDADTPYVCEEGIVPRMDEEKAIFNKTARRCAKYRRR